MKRFRHFCYVENIFVERTAIWNRRPCLSEGRPEKFGYRNCFRVRKIVGKTFLKCECCVNIQLVGERREELLKKHWKEDSKAVPLSFLTLF